MRNRNKLAVLGAAAALTLGVNVAQAAVTIVSVTTNVGGKSPYPLMAYNFTPQVLETFNERVAGSAANFTTASGLTFAATPSIGGAYIENGSSPYAYQAPAGDTSNYLALGGTTKFASNSETISLKYAANKAGFYWGSADKFNTADFYLYGKLVGAFTGSDVATDSSAKNGGKIAANGTQSAYVNFSGKFDEIVLHTTQPNYEIDNLAIGGIPETSTWAMMLLGFGGLGAMLYRRSKSTAQPSPAAFA